MFAFVRFSLIAFFMALVTPAFAGGAAVQAFTCAVEDEVTEEIMVSRASAWMKAAKTVKGGENIRVSLHWPVAANMQEGDVLFVITMPTMAEWGAFWDNYGGSAPDQLDKKNDDVSCTKARLFESVAIQ
ncbi:MAG: hypothetical protein ACR2O8_03965 [Rhizobiaceae bacterium]